MSHLPPMNEALTRRNWLVLSAAALSGCGGGAGVASLPGTGGTGVFALGAIAGFGSVIVNGIRFDDKAATVELNGLAVSPSQLRLGMVASIRGERGADPAAGVASSIEVWSIAQGLITQGGAGQFSVAGVTVQTDNATLVDGISSVAAIAPGLRVAVWGLPGNSASWLATRVAVVTDPSVVSTGVIGMSGGQRSLNGWMLMGAAADALSAGQWVRVQGTQTALSSSMAVSSAKVLESAGQSMPQGEVEIEGLVTSVPTASGFTLAGLTVDTTRATFSVPAAQITLGARVEVHGTWQSGVLQASRVELESDQSPHSAEITGTIEEFSSLGNFVVRAQRCNALGATIKNGTAANLKVGVKVKVEGYASGNMMMVTELDLLG